MNKKRCKDCDYFVEYSDKYKDVVICDGQCRRFPKSKDVDKFYWCGEFKERESE